VNSTYKARSAAEGSRVIFTAEGFSLVQQVDRLFYLARPHDAKKKQIISFRVALVDVNGGVVPLSEIFIYLDRLTPDWEPASGVPDQAPRHPIEHPLTECPGSAYPLMSPTAPV
jgi:hypothetical protein